MKDNKRGLLWFSDNDGHRKKAKVKRRCISLVRQTAHISPIYLCDAVCSPSQYSPNVRSSSTIIIVPRPHPCRCIGRHSSGIFTGIHCGQRYLLRASYSSVVRTSSFVRPSLSDDDRVGCSQWLIPIDSSISV